MANGQKGEDVVKKVGKRLIDGSGSGKEARKERMQKVLGGRKVIEEYADQWLSRYLMGGQFYFSSNLKISFLIMW